MIKELVHDTIFLARKSSDADITDISTANDLLETLTFHKDKCVGMAANMIGTLKRIICFFDGNKYTTMFNPEILKFSDCYEAEEGCLSYLGGPVKTKRYKKIKVKYYDADFKIKIKSFEGYTAQIIQHEIDHCNGILI